jgi:hypothetical protein
MKISTKLIGGFVFVAFIMLVVGAIGYGGLSRATASHEQTLKTDAATRRAVDLARNAQVQFKIQVQEWKDLLLRGHDEAAYNKYFAAFVEKEAATQKALGDLKILMSNIGLPTDTVKGALTTQTDLGVKYREALQSFVITNA